MPEYKYYFVYHKWNGTVCTQKWYGEVTVGGVPMETLQKVEITEEEFRKSLSELAIDYPFNGLP